MELNIFLLQIILLIIDNTNKQCRSRRHSSVSPPLLSCPFHLLLVLSVHAPAERAPTMHLHGPAGWYRYCGEGHNSGLNINRMDGRSALWEDVWFCLTQSSLASVITHWLKLMWVFVSVCRSHTFTVRPLCFCLAVDSLSRTDLCSASSFERSSVLWCVSQSAVDSIVWFIYEWVLELLLIHYKSSKPESFSL